jgi:kynurenine formamidase
MRSGDGTINGAIANLTADQVRAAASLVKTGRIYSLAVITNPEIHAYPGRGYQVLTAPIYIGTGDDGHTYGQNKLQGIDDFICLWCGVGTHMDGFGHVAIDGKHLHGVPTNKVIHSRGAVQYGVETIPPIASRGILLDICRLKRLDALDSDYEITREDIDAACARQGIEIRPGDVVITHTGLLKDIENKRSYRAGGEGAQNLDSEAGIGLSAAKYLVEEKGVVVVGADNWALEVIPGPEPGMFLPLHEYLLVRKGVHIMENVWTRDLAREQVYEFLFVVAGPKLGGAVQMPIHPIAIC